MDGNIFDGLAALAIIGLFAIVLLMLAAPFGLWWIWNHIQLVVR